MLKHSLICFSFSCQWNVHHKTMRWSNGRDQRGLTPPPTGRMVTGEDTHGDHDCQLLFPWRWRMSKFTDLWQLGGGWGVGGWTPLHLGGETLAACEMEPNKVTPKVTVRPVTPAPPPHHHPTLSGCTEGRREGISCLFPRPFWASNMLADPGCGAKKACAGRGWTLLKTEAKAKLRSLSHLDVNLRKLLRSEGEVRSLAWLIWTCINETR